MTTELNEYEQIELISMCKLRKSDCERTIEILKDRSEATDDDREFIIKTWTQTINKMNHLLKLLES